MNYVDNLETERLVTRWLTSADVPLWVAFFDDPVNCTYIRPFMNGPAEKMAADMIAKQLNRYQEGTYGMQALVRKDSGEMIGMCGLLQQHINDVNEVEVGYHLLRRYWGRGYATEAARMFRDYALNNSDVNSIVSIIHPQNTPSKNVAMRNGMHFSEQGMFKGAPFDIYRIHRADWSDNKEAGM